MQTIPGAAGASRDRPVSLVGQPRAKGQAFRFPNELAEVPLAAAGPRQRHPRRLRSAVRAARPALPRCWPRWTTWPCCACSRATRNSVALLPTVVVQDELRSGGWQSTACVPDLYESFYAITVQRHFEPPLLQELLQRPEADVLGDVAPRAPGARRTIKSASPSQDRKAAEDRRDRSCSRSDHCFVANMRLRAASLMATTAGASGAAPARSRRSVPTRPTCGRRRSRDTSNRSPVRSPKAPGKHRHLPCRRLSAARCRRTRRRSSA